MSKSKVTGTAVVWFILSMITGCLLPHSIYYVAQDQRFRFVLFHQRSHRCNKTKRGEIVHRPLGNGAHPFDLFVICLLFFFLLALVFFELRAEAFVLPFPLE